MGAELVVAPADEEGLVELARDAAAIMTNWRRVPEEALDAAARCVVVARYGIGLDNIPVAHATELGIAVVNVPDFCLDEVAEHTLALLLACARRVVALARETRSGRWGLDAARGSSRLRGRTAGLVGYGRTARALAPKLTALGLEVLAWAPSLAPGPVEPGVTAVDGLEPLLQASDFVCLHVPSTPATHGLIGERELRSMKPTAYLVNTARGALVDEAALARAIADRVIAGAALDVLVEEPPAADHPLLGLDGVIVTPHAAFYSEQSVADVQRRAAEQVATALRGELPPYLVNPEVLARPACRLAVPVA